MEQFVFGYGKQTHHRGRRRRRKLAAGGGGRHLPGEFARMRQHPRGGVLQRLVPVPADYSADAAFAVVFKIQAAVPQRVGGQEQVFNFLPVRHGHFHAGDGNFIRPDFHYPFAVFQIFDVQPKIPHIFIRLFHKRTPFYI